MSDFQSSFHINNKHNNTDDANRMFEPAASTYSQEDSRTVFPQQQRRSTLAFQNKFSQNESPFVPKRSLKAQSKEAHFIHKISLEESVDSYSAAKSEESLDPTAAWGAQKSPLG